MEVPILNKKQLKKTLAGKKTKKETIKNVLATPFDNYWPLVTQEDQDVIKNVLEKFLPRIRIEKPKISYSEIKAIPKSERKKFRENYNKQDVEINKNDRLGLIFGINLVSKLLEKYEAGSIILENNVQPHFMVQHIIDQSVLYDCPIVIIQNLRDILQNQCGITSVCIGLKKNLEHDSKLNLIHQAICNVSEKYPVPRNHINSKRKLNQPISSVISLSPEMDTNDIVEDNKQDMSVIEILDSSLETSLMSSEEVKLPTKILHLNRKTTNDRAFIPQISEEPTSNKDRMIDVDCGTFLAIQPHNKQNLYKGLRVKRIKGDKKRERRKMQLFKR